MSLNRHQREYIRELNQRPRELLCWCGWYAANECGSWCDKSGKGLTAADKDKESCVECGSAPWFPGGAVNHTRGCSARTDE